MTRPTQRLEVCLIEHHGFIASMRNDVVDNLCQKRAAGIRLTVKAEGMRGAEAIPETYPASGVVGRLALLEAPLLEPMTSGMKGTAS